MRDTTLVVFSPARRKGYVDGGSTAPPDARATWGITGSARRKANLRVKEKSIQPPYKHVEVVKTVTSAWRNLGCLQPRQTQRLTLKSLVLPDAEASGSVKRFTVSMLMAAMIPRGLWALWRNAQLVWVTVVSSLWPLTTWFLSLSSLLLLLERLWGGGGGGGTGRVCVAASGAA